MNIKQYLNEELADNNETREVLKWFIQNANSLSLKNEVKKGMNIYSLQKTWREQAKRDDIDTNKVYWKNVLQKLYFKFS